ncbi:MAG: preprotein translocase subunit SecE [Oscillospiraceae bacterium]|jgi:preprotein translocase subunit SecE|nr:preprotein translocase subunit SecE [Oscillospiraceae bacterium]
MAEETAKNKPVSNKPLAKKKKESIFKRLSRYLKSVWAESKKVQWPSKEQLKTNTLVVLSVIVAAGVFIWLSDVAMTFVMRLMVGG